MKIKIITWFLTAIVTSYVVYFFVYRAFYKPIKASDKNNVVKFAVFNQWAGFMQSKKANERVFLNIISDKYNTELDLDNTLKHDIGIYGPFSSQNQPPNSPISIFFTGEAYLLPKLSYYDLVLGFDYIDKPNYLRFPLYYFYFADKLNTSYKRGKCEPDKKKYFACFLYTSNYPSYDGCIQRSIFFKKLSKYKIIASGGSHLNNIGYVVSVADTLSWLSECKFVIAYENSTKDGYTTEKAFQAYFAGAIPLYYGNKLYYKDLNSKAVIYQDDYKSMDKMIEYIKKVDQDDDLYCKIWNEPIITSDFNSYDDMIQKLKIKYDEIIIPKLEKIKDTTINIYT